MIIYLCTERIFCCVVLSAERFFNGKKGTDMKSLIALPKDKGQAITAPNLMDFE